MARGDMARPVGNLEETGVHADAAFGPTQVRCDFSSFASGLFAGMEQVRPLTSCVVTTSSLVEAVETESVETSLVEPVETSLVEPVETIICPSWRS